MGLLIIPYLILVLAGVAFIVKIPFLLFQAIYWFVVKRVSRIQIPIFQIVGTNALVRAATFGIFFVVSSFPLGETQNEVLKNFFSIALLVLTFILPAYVGIASDLHILRNKKIAITKSLVIHSLILNLLSSGYTQIFAGAVGASCMRSGGC